MVSLPDDANGLKPFLESDKFSTESDKFSTESQLIETQKSHNCSSNRFRRGNQKCYIPKRYIFSLMGLIACSLSVNFNTNISIAIVSMVNRSSPIVTLSSNECRSETYSDYEKQNDSSKYSQLGEFHWTPDTEGIAIAAAYYGQLFGFIPGGRLAEIYGGKPVLIGSVLLASIFTILCPIAARLSTEIFILCRFVIGIGTAPAIPVLLYLISKWIPATERNFHASFVLAGYGVGSFAGFIIAGELSGLTFLSGWPLVFYVGGLAGCVWCLISCFLIYENPHDHPTISSEEFRFINENMPIKKHKQIKNIPWKQMALSVPLWALALGYFGQFWILGFFCTSQSLYMGTVLNLDIVLNGQLSCLPHLARALFAVVCSYPADHALRNKWVGTGFIRKAATLSNTLVTSAAFVGILLAGCDPVHNTALFIIASLLGDFVTFGVCMTVLDIAPDLSGTVSGLMNLISVVPFFVIPSIVGWVTMYERTMKQWSYVFYSIIVVALGTTFIYLVFGTSNPQSWGVAADMEAVENKKHSKKELKHSNKVQSNPIV